MFGFSTIRAATFNPCLTEIQEFLHYFHCTLAAKNESQRREETKSVKTKVGTEWWQALAARLGVRSYVRLNNGRNVLAQHTFSNIP